MYLFLMVTSVTWAPLAISPWVLLSSVSRLAM